MANCRVTLNTDRLSVFSVVLRTAVSDAADPMPLKTLLFPCILIMLFPLLSACGASNGEYRRGETAYRSGEANIQQPDITVTPERSFTGIRVAGPDTDIDLSYWKGLLRLHGSRDTFDVFSQRYYDLSVNETGAAEAALQSFRAFARNHEIGQEFENYWSNRR